MQTDGVDAAVAICKLIFGQDRSERAKTTARSLARHTVEREQRAEHLRKTMRLKCSRHAAIRFMERIFGGADGLYTNDALMRDIKGQVEYEVARCVDEHRALTREGDALIVEDFWRGIRYVVARNGTIKTVLTEVDAERA